jgi:hypothetical protein
MVKTITTRSMVGSGRCIIRGELLPRLAPHVEEDADVADEVDNGNKEAGEAPVAECGTGPKHAEEQPEMIPRVMKATIARCGLWCLLCSLASIRAGRARGGRSRNGRTRPANSTWAERAGPGPLGAAPASRRGLLVDPDQRYLDHPSQADAVQLAGTVTAAMCADLEHWCGSSPAWASRAGRLAAAA